MIQTIICNVRGCGFCSENGFCLNRLTVITDQGICKYITKPGWDRKVDEEEKNTGVFVEEKEEIELIEGGDG